MGKVFRSLGWRGRWAIAILSAIAMPGSFYAEVAAAPLPPAPAAEQKQSGTGDLLLEQGNQHYRAGKLDAAIQSWRQAQQAYQQQANRQGESIALLNVGMGLVSAERYQEAISILDSYLQREQSESDALNQARALSNLGIAYKALGNYAQAIEAQRQAGKRMRSLGDRQGLGQVLVNLGNVFEVVGDYESAAIAYQQSLKLARETSDRVGEGIALGNLGTIYADIGKNKEAIATFQQSLAINRATNDLAGEASLLINLGATHHSQQELDIALTYYQQSLQIAQKLNDRQRQSEALGSLGLVYEDLKAFPKSIEYHQKSLEIGRSLKDPKITGIALNNLAHILFKAGKLTEAEARLREAIQLLDALRPGLSDTYQVFIFDTQLQTYNLLQQVLVANKKYHAALEAAEQGRARAFVELLSKRTSAQNRTAAPESHTVDSPKPDSTKPDSLPPLLPRDSAPQPPITIAQIQQVARDQHATLVEYAIVPDHNFKFRGKQRGREAEVFIWVVSPTGAINFRAVDLKPLWQQHLTLAQVVGVARNCLAPASNCNLVADPTQAETPPTAPLPPGQKRRRSNPALKRLYQLLIQPIAEWLPSDPEARVIFVPQESLFLVPFPALQAQDGSYLVEQHTPLTAPAIQVLALTHQQRQAKTLHTETSKPSANPTSTRRAADPRSPLIVGNPTMPKLGTEILSPLPAAEAEAKQIASLFHTTALIGNQATERAIVQQMPQAEIIHLATHGLLEYKQATGDVGIPGAIALAPSPVQSSSDGSLSAGASDRPATSSDGFLTANEIVDLRLNADLVVLSACDTGRGQITGDGVVGLSRAFVSAGVPSLVVSLWAVSDVSTAQLMVTFYQTLQHNPDKARALRLAMLATMKGHPYPVDWAAFTLVGEAD